MDLYEAGKHLETIAKYVKLKISSPAYHLSPKLTRLTDGRWMAYYGDTSADALNGVCPAGVGRTPQLAMQDFDARFITGDPIK